MPDTIKLGVLTHDTEISYINLYKRLETIDLVNEDSFRNVFNDVQFEEEVGVEYNSLPLYVGWAYIPVVIDGLVEVKILKLEQGNGIAIILPEMVATTYQVLEDDITQLDVINANIDLVGDLYGLDETDNELIELIKTLYVNIGNNAPAFRLTTEGEHTYEDEIKDSEENQDNLDLGLGLGGAPSRGGSENQSFGSISQNQGIDNVNEIEDISVNEEAYKRFKKDTTVLEELIQKLYRETPYAIKEHITTQWSDNKNVLFIRVDNKAIYETFNTIPKHARSQISQIGETLRLNPETQIIDSFKHNGGRIFSLVENTHSNLWKVKNEEIKPFNENQDKTLYISKKPDIIEVEQSSIRQEARHFIPRSKDGKTVFSVK